MQKPTVISAKPIEQPLPNAAPPITTPSDPKSSIIHPNIQPHKGAPAPYPVPAMELQRLIDVKDMETTPKKHQSYSSTEIPLYPKSTTKVTNPNFDSLFIKRARIPSFTHEIVRPAIPRESYNDDLFLGDVTKSNLTWAGNQKKGTPSLKAP